MGGPFTRKMLQIGISSQYSNVNSDQRVTMATRSTSIASQEDETAEEKKKSKRSSKHTKSVDAVSRSRPPSSILISATYGGAIFIPTGRLHTNGSCRDRHAQRQHEAEAEIQ